MRAKLILALVLIAIGIAVMIWNAEQPRPHNQSPDSAAAAPAGKFDPAIRRIGHVLVVSGVLFLALAVRQRFRKPPSPENPESPPQDRES
jgi:hypothetical protein